MNYIRMFIVIVLTLLIIINVNKKKDRIIPLCTSLYGISVLNDIFNAGKPIELVNSFGISFQLTDILLCIFFGGLFLSLFSNSHIKRSLFNVFLTYFFIVLLLGTIIGMTQNGLSSEWIGDIRTLYLFFFGIMYFTRTFKNEYIEKNIKIIDSVMMFILVLSVILWLLDIIFGIRFLESQLTATLSDGGSTMRFIQAGNVLGIALYTLYLVRKDIGIKGYIGIKASAFIVAVILFQHRSVWVALFAGLVLIVFQESLTIKNVIRLYFQLFIIMLLTVSFLLFSSGDLVINFQNSIALFWNLITGGSVENTTLSTRLDVWDAVIDDLQGLPLLIGRSFGYGYGESIGWNTSPHSSYIRVLGRMGYIGLITLILFIYLLFRKEIRGKIAYAPEFILCIAVYMYAYDFTWLCGIVLGGCIAIMNNKVQKNNYKNTPVL